MKALNTLIKENKKYITTNKVFYAYSSVSSNGDDGYLVDINELTDEQLNKRYSEIQWWIEDGDLCLHYK